MLIKKYIWKSFLNTVGYMVSNCMSTKKIFQFSVLLLLFAIGHSALAQSLSEKARKHIFKGEINRQGKAVGCHHILAINEYKTSQLVEGTRKDGPNGLFKAKVKVKNGSGKWIAKVSNGGYSTFYPESWSEEKTEKEILQAFKNKRKVNGDLWEGKSSEGIIIQMYLRDDDSIASAFPKDWSR
jgi:Bacterial EndoU nuclease